MNRLFALMLSIALLLTLIPEAAFADDQGSALGSVETNSSIATQVMTPKKIVVYIKPDLTVQWQGKTQLFKNEQGQPVYPMIYNGSTYLSVRAISALMQEPLEYNKRFQIIFIGRTLTDAGSNGVGIPHGAATTAPSDTVFNHPKPNSQIAWTKPDLLIMYNYAIQTFLDANGMLIHPIVYNGTTYLPIRAIANLMNEKISYDDSTKTIAIGKAMDPETDLDTDLDTETIPPTVTTTKTALQTLTALYQEETLLYDESTAKIINIKIAVTEEDKAVLAASISEDHVEAQEMIAALKNIDESVMSASDRDLYDRIYAFFEATEYYLLVLENIAHLNAQGADYSMLAETFLYFAMDSRTKMQEARP